MWGHKDSEEALSAKDTLSSLQYLSSWLSPLIWSCRLVIDKESLPQIGE